MKSRTVTSGLSTPKAHHLRGARQFHGIVQHAANHDDCIFWAIDEEVPWTMDNCACRAGAFTAQAQVPGTHAITKLWANDAAGSAWLLANVAKRSDEQGLIAQARSIAKLFVRPVQDIDDVVLRRRGHSIPRHRFRAVTRSAALRPSWPMVSSSCSSAMST